MNEWIPTYRALPEEEYEEDGGGVCVLALHWPEHCPDAGHEMQVSNVIYVRRNPERFSHWMPLPELP